MTICQAAFNTLMFVSTGSLFQITDSGQNSNTEERRHAALPWLLVGFSEKHGVDQEQVPMSGKPETTNNAMPGLDHSKFVYQRSSSSIVLHLHLHIQYRIHQPANQPHSPISLCLGNVLNSYFIVVFGGRSIKNRGDAWSLLLFLYFI